MPRAVLITQLDRARADFDETVALCQRLLSDAVQPVHLPMHDDDGSVAGLLTLLDQRVVDVSGGRRVVRDADPEHLALIADLRAELVEGVIAESEDETLLDRYLAGEEVDPAVLTADLETAVARGHFHPALAAAPLAGVGLHELLDLLVDGFPSPLEHPCPPVTLPDGSPTAPLQCDPDGPLVAEVVRTATDPYVGRVSWVRVFSGTLRPDTAVHVSGHGAGGPWQRPDHPDHDADDRIGPLTSPLGSALRPVASCPAGDLCVVSRLHAAETGDTLSSPQAPRLVAPWPLPEPQLPVAVEAVSRTDEERLGAALSRLTAEDPTVRVERQPQTGQQLLWCVGPGHADVLLDRLRQRHGVSVRTPEVVVPLQETLAGPVKVTGRTSSSPAVTGSTPSWSSRWRPVPRSGVQFSQRLWAALCRAPSTAAWRRASAPRPSEGVRKAVPGGRRGGARRRQVARRGLVDAAFQAAGALAVREATAAAGPWC
jgi:elongation factor G